MRRIVIVLGGLLLALGIGSQFAGSHESIWSWALVPAILGTILLVLGLASLRPAWQPTMLRAATLVAVVGFLVTVAALVELLKTLLKEPAMLSNAATSILCGMLAIVGAKWMLAGRFSKSETKPPGA